MKVFVHLINSIGTGGAESNLALLMKSDITNRHLVLYLRKSPEVNPNFEGLEGSMFFLNLTKFNLIFVLWRINNHIVSNRPDVLISWLYISDFIFSIYKVLFRIKIPLFWNIRNGEVNFRYISISSYLSAVLCSKLFNKIPNGIIVNSRFAEMNHVVVGYDAKKFIYVPNALNIVRFPEVDLDAYSHKGLGPIIFGCVARYDIQKNHSLLFHAFANVARLMSEVKFELHLVGSGIESANDLHKLSKTLGINDYIVWRNSCDNMNHFYRKTSYHILPSIKESMPNVLVESMYCGIPNIVSNVGDCVEIVGRQGFVFESNNLSSLTESLLQAIQLYVNDYNSYKELKLRCKERVVNSYSIGSLVSSFDKLI